MLRIKMKLKLHYRENSMGKQIYSDVMSLYYPIRI